MCSWLLNCMLNYMIKPFHSSLPFLLMSVFLCGFPFCNDHHISWCEQIWESLVTVVTMGMLQLDGHGLVFGLLLSPCLKSFNHFCNPRLWASLLGHC